MRIVGRSIELVLAAALALWMSSCESGEDYDSSVRRSLGVSAITPQEVQERIWPEIALRELFTVPADTGVYFLLPRAVRADASGNFFVMDYGDYKVKGFDREGNHIASYGSGEGQGPGEFALGVSDLGVLEDSAVYVTDRIEQRVSLFGIEGRLLKTYPLTRQLGNRIGRPFRHSTTSQGHRYTMFTSGQKLFEASAPNAIETTSFGPPLDMTGSKMSQVDGMIISYQERLVYAPVHYPVILQYDPDGSVVYARGTVDYGQTELPYTISETVNGILMEKTGGRDVHGTASASGNRIYVEVFLESVRSFDVYEAGSGRCEHSFRSVSGYDVFAIGDRLYQALDSTVAVWAIDRKEP